ncbi:MAG TPA: hypothetical protein VJR58_05970 [Vineibacter sp.]|nr:hypothetical protein [Vineibacter sp.]
MGPEELAAVEKAKAAAAQQQAARPADDTSVADVVDAGLTVADIATTEAAGSIVSGTLDAVGSAAEAVADAAGSIVEGIGSILDGL